MAHNIVGFDGWDQKENHVGGSLTVEESITSYSRVANRQACSNSTAQFAQWGVAGQFIYASFHMYVVTLPGSGQYYYLTRQFSGSWRGWTRINSDGTVTINRESGGTTTSTGTITTGVWYVVSIRRGTGVYPKITVRVRDTGATVADAEVAANDDGIAPCYFGAAINSYGDVIFDNFVWESGGEDPVLLLTTKYAVGNLMPRANGDYNAWTNDWTYTDEFPNDGATTERTLGGAYGAFTEALQPCKDLSTPVGTIHGVRQYFWHHSSSGSVTYSFRFRISSTNYDTDSNGWGPGGYQLMSRVRLTNPYTSGAWSMSDVDSIQIGLERSQVSTGYTAHCTMLGLAVLYEINPRQRRKVIKYTVDAFDLEQRVVDNNGVSTSLEEVFPDAWVFMAGTIPLFSDRALDFMEDEYMFYLEEITYSQTADQRNLSLVGNTDDFLEMLLNRIQSSGGGI